MNFDELAYFLEKRLLSEMPGEKAHNIMKPTLASGAPIHIKHALPPRESGVLILLYEDQGVIKFPLIQRPKYEGIHSGQIALPGGKKEPEDRNLIHTALREAEEEIGVSASAIEVIGHLSKFYVSASNYNVLPVIGKIISKPAFILEEREVEGVIEPSLIDIVDPQRRKQRNMLVREEIEMICPYFDLENKVVWGATAMMLSELVVILNEFQETLTKS